MNISGILVQCRPENISEIILSIQECDFCDYHLHDDKGKIVVTIEGENTEEELKKLKQLQSFNHIITADMMYSYSEDELDGLRSDLEKEAQIPSWLNDPNVKAQDIKYNGDLKKRY